MPDQRAKSNFFSDILSGGVKALGARAAGAPEPTYTSSTEQVSAGFFDILYERVRSGKDKAVRMAAERFGKTKTGRTFIDETKKQEIEMLFRSPWTWAVIAFLGVGLMMLRGR